MGGDTWFRCWGQAPNLQLPDKAPSIRPLPALQLCGGLAQRFVRDPDPRRLRVCRPLHAAAARPQPRPGAEIRGCAGGGQQAGQGGAQARPQRAQSGGPIVRITLKIYVALVQWEVGRPGATRLNLSWFSSEAELEFVLGALELVAGQGWTLEAPARLQVQQRD